MQNNLSDPAPKKPGNVLKYVLLAFVAASIGAAVYKVLPCCSAAKAAALPAETAAAAAAPTEKEQAKTPAAPVKTAPAKTTAAKTAVVYYFYTNTRCSSCKTIEAYTKEAIEKNFTADYKGWKVVFKGVNIEDEPNEHFKQDYWLNSKSVVVQKFSGEKALKWGKLEKVWQLLDDKEAFMAYVTGETHKLLDEK